MNKIINLTLFFYEKKFNLSKFVFIRKLVYNNNKKYLAFKNCKNNISSSSLETEMQKVYREGINSNNLVSNNKKKTKTKRLNNIVTIVKITLNYRKKPFQ